MKKQKNQSGPSRKKKNGHVEIYIATRRNILSFTVIIGEGYLSNEKVGL